MAVSVRACARACVHACEHACVRVCVGSVSDPSQPSHPLKGVHPVRRGRHLKQVKCDSVHVRAYNVCVQCECTDQWCVCVQCECVELWCVCVQCQFAVSAC